MVDTELLLHELRKHECYLEDGHFRLVSGKHSPIYIQMRIALMIPHIRELFGKQLAELLDASKLNPTALAANTIGGILLARETASRLRRPVPTLIGRGKAEAVTWANKRRIGQEALGKVILIGDVVTTGESLRSVAASLESEGATVVGMVVALDRREAQTKVAVHSGEFEPIAILSLPLKAYDPGVCPLCPAAVTDLGDEDDFVSMVLCMPPRMARMIIDGYRRVYKLQRDRTLLEMANLCRRWLPALLGDLPLSRVTEDTRLEQFMCLVVHPGETDAHRKRVLKELVGHLLAVSNIREEVRSLGCSIVVADEKDMRGAFGLEVPSEVPDGIGIPKFGAAKLSELISYYDALQETRAVFLFDKDGKLVSVRYLDHPGALPGLRLVKEFTGECDAIGLVLRRGRRIIYVYRNGSINGVAELSEKTGVWEFKIPSRNIEVIKNSTGVGDTLEIALEVSREMVARGYGGLFVLGDVRSELKTKRPKIGVREQKLAHIETGMAAEIAKLDGAVFLSMDGRIKAVSTVIVSSPDIEPPDDSDGTRVGGSRRETAWRTSQQLPNVPVICVSQNGTIDIYLNGVQYPVYDPLKGLSQE